MRSFDREEEASTDQQGIDNAFPLAITTSHNYCLQLPIDTATATERGKKEFNKVADEELNQSSRGR